MVRRKQALHSVFGSIAAIAIGVVAAVMLSPKAATGASLEMAGYTCFETDLCHDGAQPCCFEIPENPVGEGRCSTMCGGGCAC